MERIQVTHPIDPVYDENSEVLWLDVEEALARDDVPELTKKLIESVL